MNRNAATTIRPKCILTRTRWPKSDWAKSLCRCQSPVSVCPLRHPLLSRKSWGSPWSCITRTSCFSSCVSISGRRLPKNWCYATMWEPRNIGRELRSSGRLIFPDGYAPEKWCSTIPKTEDGLKSRTTTSRGYIPFWRKRIFTSGNVCLVNIFCPPTSSVRLPLWKVRKALWYPASICRNIYGLLRAERTEHLIGMPWAYWETDVSCSSPTLGQPTIGTAKWRWSGAWE